MVFFSTLRFENRVVLDGSQTGGISTSTVPAFENRVVLDGSQTSRIMGIVGIGFESRVILDGSQTIASAIR